MKIQVLLTPDDVRQVLEEKLFESLPDEVLDPEYNEIKCYWKHQDVYLDLDTLQLEVKLKVYNTDGEAI